MQLLIGVEVQVLATGALLRVGGADRQEVGVFVLHVLVVAPDPAPIDDGMRGRHLRELLPQVRVLERPRLAAPAARFPILAPLVHAFHEIFGIGNEPLLRPDPTCAPANSASHFVCSMTRATAAPGVPCSMCVTNVTPSSDSTASAPPTTIVPIAGSIVA